MGSSGANPTSSTDDQVVAQEGLDDLADAVVGEAAVEGLDEFGGGEVPDPVAASTAAWPRAIRVWLLPVPAGPMRVRFSLARDPFQGGEVGPGRGGMLLADRSNSSMVLSDGEAGLLAAQPGVAGVAGGDLGLDQGPQQLFGCPALGLRGDQQLGGDAAHAGELEPAQPVARGRRPAAAGVAAVISVPPPIGRSRR